MSDVYVCGSSFITGKLILILYSSSDRIYSLSRLLVPCEDMTDDDINIISAFHHTRQRVQTVERFFVDAFVVCSRSARVSWCWF